MLQFKRLPSDIVPTVEGNNVVLAETSSGDLILTDSDGSKPIATKHDIKVAANEVSTAFNTELTSKADMSIVNELAEKYNNAIEVINNLSERVAALESNYDPTVIK